jgi:hypothetical protein
VFVVLTVDVALIFAALRRVGTTSASAVTNAPVMKSPQRVHVVELQHV